MRFLGPASIALAGFLGLMAGPAFAQSNTRSWLSGAGTTTDCTRASPCPNLGSALSATVAGGVINVLEGGGFGSATVIRSVSIVGSGATGSILSFGNNGLTVNLPNDTDKVMIENFEIDGFGAGVDGIRITGKGRVYVRRCTIRNFGGNAISVVGASGARVYVVDSDLVGNGGGLNVQGQSGAPNYGTLINTTVDSNVNFAVQVGGGGNKITLERSRLSGSGVAISNQGGTVVSVGASNFLTGSGVPTQTQATQ